MLTRPVFDRLLFSPDVIYILLENYDTGSKAISRVPKLFLTRIVPGLFHDFSRSKLRFSRTVICDKKCCHSPSDHLSLQEKYSLIISYLFLKKFHDFSRTFSCFSFYPDFSRPGNLFFIFQVFKVFQVRGNPAFPIRAKEINVWKSLLFSSLWG